MMSWNKTRTGAPIVYARGGALPRQLSLDACAPYASGNAKKARAKKHTRKRSMALLIAVALGMLLLTGCASLEAAAQNGDTVAGLLSSRSESINILLLLTVLSLLPSILIMLTSFTRIVIVLSLVRNGTGLQQMPPNQVLIGLALFLTFFVMTPVINEIKDVAYEPYVNEDIEAAEAITLGMEPLRNFMLAQTYESDLSFFISVSGEEFAPNPEATTQAEIYAEIPTSALIPAFITSEIKQGFKIGFYIYIPFIVIDMIVASTLMAMGMMMLPPVVISLPFKILLFVLVDGWTLTMKAVLGSFQPY